MSVKNLLALVFACGIIVFAGITCWAAETSTKAEELFSLAERLEKAQPWTYETIEEITGRKLHKESISGYDSDETPDGELLRRIEVETDPRAPIQRRITGVWLCLPRQGLGISRSQVVDRFGKWDKKSRKKTFDEDALKRFGYRTLIDYEYKRKNGGWLSFDVDDDNTKQLRIIEITSWD